MNAPSPLDAQYLIRAGQRHHAAGDLAAAERSYLQAQRLQPDNPQIQFLLGMIALAHGNAPAAVELFGAALQAKPTEPAVRLQLARALQQSGRQEEARALARSTADDNPGELEAQYTLALILCQQRRHDEALVEAERALQLRPDGVDEMLLLSALYPALGRWDQARQIAEAAVRAHPRVPETQRNHALACLIHGDMPRGWEAFEHRPELKHPAGTKLWQHEDLHGKSILLYGEGGFGDAIQFARYVPQVKALAKKTVLACPAELLELFRENFPVDQLIPQNQPWPASDYVCPLPSLPFHFRTTLETIPRDVPYLRAPARKAATWAPHMTNPVELKVGLVWAGSNIADKQRSRTLRTFAPLAGIAGVRFYSLQKGLESWQVAAAPEQMHIVDFMPRVRDFADLAGIIAHLDLVITIDTSVAHLAGAMGKPVWTLIPFVPDFRWMLERTDSPWYPTMRLYRQQAPNDWSAPMAELAADLQDKIRKGRVSTP